MVTPTAHEKMEWSRLAQDAYRTGRNGLGHRYSARASDPAGTRLHDAAYDAIQTTYRQWLIGGWDAVEDFDTPTGD